MFKILREVSSIISLTILSTSCFAARIRSLTLIARFIVLFFLYDFGRNDMHETVVHGIPLAVTIYMKQLRL